MWFCPCQSTPDTRGEVSRTIPDPSVPRPHGFSPMAPRCSASRCARWTHTPLWSLPPPLEDELGTTRETARNATEQLEHEEQWGRDWLPWCYVRKKSFQLTRAAIYILMSLGQGVSFLLVQKRSNQQLAAGMGRKGCNRHMLTGNMGQVRVQGWAVGPPVF